MIHVILNTPAGPQVVCRTNDRAYAEYYCNWVQSAHAAMVVEVCQISQEKANGARVREGRPEEPVHVLPLFAARNLARNQGSLMSWLEINVQ